MIAGKFHVCGGLNDEKCILASTEYFDSSLGHWVSVSDMSEARDGAAVAVLR